MKTCGVNFLFFEPYFAFKSYYVVWKPQKLWEQTSCEKCLNRTMQYGNKKDVNDICGLVLV